MFIKVICGLAFLTLGVLAIIKWKDAFWVLFTGGLGLFLLLIGVIILAAVKE